MGLRPYEWSVIIIGRWNRAILTPAGIARRVFGLDEFKQLYVAVPLDGVSPYQVRHPTGNITVRTDETRLRIHLEKEDYQTLKYAMVAGASALTSLPETPVSAAGFNVGFLMPEITPELAAMVAGDIDSRLAGMEHDIAARTLGRSLEYGVGKLNIGISCERKVEAEEFRLSCNFHRASEDTNDLKEWLQTPVDEVQSTIEKLLEALDLTIEEAADAIDEE